MHINRNLKSIFIFCTACFLAAAVFLFLFRYDNKYTARSVISQDGMTMPDCSRLDAHRLTYLADGWELFKGTLLPPGDSQADSSGAIKTYIGQYQNFSYFNSDHSPYGVATYRLRLRSDSSPHKTRQYILLFQEIFSACDIYVDGTLVGSSGSLSPYSPRVMDLAVPITLSGDTEVIVHVANYTHYYSGITYPPILGTALAIHRHSFIRAGFYGLLCFSSLALALFSAAVWLLNRRSRGDERLYLWFGLLSLSFSLRISYPFIRAVGIPVIRPLYAVEDAAFLLGIWCTFKIVFCLCNMEKSKPEIVLSRIAFHAVLTGALFPAFVMPLFPAFIPVYSQIMFWYKALTAVVLVGLAFYGASLSIRNFSWVLTGAGVYGTSLLAHVLTLGSFEPAYTGWQDEYGVFGLVFCFAVMMVLRSFHLLRENYRLNEHLQDDVDKKTKRLTSVLEERRQFLAGAAHDLKAPMTSLQLFAQSIEENGVGLDDETLGSIRVIRQKSSQMQSRLLELQSFALEDAQPRNPEPLDLAMLVSDFYNTNLPDMEASGVSFLLGIPPQPCMMMGDRQQLWRILQNIVYNALEFTPMDGTISMTLKRALPFAVLTLSDTGSGIAAEDLPHIFDRFFSRRKEEGGSGLGLYLAKSFVLEHDGEISADSEPGHGTVFTIRFHLIE